MKKELFDIGIIGAGPAGSTFAREVAKLCPELKIILIDGQSKCNSKPCGGLLNPDAQRVLAEFSLVIDKDLLVSPQIFDVETFDLHSRDKCFYPRNYINLDRYKFDKWLVALIPDSVKVVDARAKSVKLCDDGYEIITDAGEFLVKSIVGADGGGSIVRRSLGINMQKQYVAIQEWYKNEGQSVPYYSCIFDKKTSDSCSWTIHKDEHIIFGGAFEKQGCKLAFEKQKERLEAFIGTSLGEVEKREACLVSSPRSFSSFHCGVKNAYLLGEAAGFISASSFEGISSAMLSGKYLADAFKDGKNPSKILAKYKKNTRSLRIKLYLKTIKRAILCSPILRHLIMKSKITALNK